VTRIFLLIFIAVLAGAAYWAVYLRGSQPQGDAGRGGPGGGRPTYVVATAVAEADFAIRIDAVGTAKARESITVTAKSQDTISAINFQDGQFVPAGYVIVEMTSRQQSAQVAEARAALAEADSQFNRAQTLASQGLAAQALLDQRRAQRDTAAARVRNQEAQVSDRLIRAPFDGVLGLRQVSMGSLVRPGDVITTLDDVTIIKLDLAVPETSLGLLSTGMSVDVVSAGFPGKVLTGVVTGIDSRVDPSSRTVAVRTEVQNSDALLKPGMLLAASLRADPRRALMVPEAAIVPLGPERFVYVVGADGKAERRAVKTGRRNLGQVEVLDGLRIGEMVVTEGVVKLRPGAPITLTPPSERGKDRGQGGARGPSGGRPASAAP
jgi:membrane fusion protein, multidrug efflux system